MFRALGDETRQATHPLLAAVLADYVVVRAKLGRLDDAKAAQARLDAIREPSETPARPGA